MNFDEYAKNKRGDYADLAATVATILTAATSADPQLRLQHVQHRAKDPERLRSKLEDRSAIECDNIEEVVKDLAGCRLVFYTNSDVSRFLSSGIVRENFGVDWDRTKIHHPQPDASDPNELFISNNYVVKLTDARVALPEYAKFRDMWCEVQVQTALNHAWSEMAHDTIYKKPKLKGFGGTLMRGIEERMTTIMRKFLLPAGYEFQKVQSDFERLSSGKELFDRGALQALAECDDNNARHDLLEQFKTYVLPNYDDIAAVYPEIRASLITAVHRSRKTAVKAVETPFGNLPGKNAEDIAEIVADILERLRYVDVDATFDTLSELYPGAKSEDERERWLRLAQRLSHHELDTWKQAGPIVQSLLVQRISKLSEGALEELRPIVLEMLEQVLQPELSGTTSTYNTVTFHKGAVTASDLLARTRSDAISILELLFRSAKNDVDRRAVVHALSASTRMPHAGAPSQQLISTVLENTLRVVRFYAEVAGTLSYELLQSLEHDLLWLYRHNRVEPDETDFQDAARLRDNIRQSILTFRDGVNRDQRFVVYKTLVGFQSVFPPEWDDDGFNFKGREAYREQRIDELVEQVDEQNASEWILVLQRCAQTQSNDLATFPSFGKFLEKVAQRKPGLLIRHIDELDPRLARFLPAILFGLETGSEKDRARGKVKQWIEERRQIQQVVHYLRFSNAFDSGLLENALKAAIEVGNDGAVVGAISAAVARNDDVEGGLLNRVLLPGLDYLTSKGNTQWVDAVWPPPNKVSIFATLDQSQADAVLAALVHHPQIDYEHEEILAAIAAKHPQKVVDFFGKRLATKEEAEFEQRYDAIPFQFHLLSKALSEIPDYLIAEARKWFEQDSSLFTYRGGRLLSITFPNLLPERSLLSLVRTGARKDIEFVLATLRAYEGQTSLHELCKEIIHALPPNDPLLQEVQIILESTGVLTGEFGRVTALTEKKNEVEAWLNDQRDRVRAFAERYRHSLDNQIADEQRRSEESLELRKREYGEEVPEAGT